MTETVQSLWRGDDVPPSWLDSILIPLYKKKGARTDWNNWRGVVLLNIASKVHAILLNRALQNLSTKIVPQSQKTTKQAMVTSASPLSPEYHQAT